MYDNVDCGANATPEEKKSALRKAIAHDFELDTIPFYTEDETCRAMLPPPRDTGRQYEHWAKRLIDKGIPNEEVGFLYQVLNPDPTQRWTARDILETGLLETST